MNPDTLLSSENPILVDFSADWCATCQVLDPILNELTGNLPDELFLKIDTEQHPQIAAAFSVKSIPTLIIFEKGEVIWRHSGVISKSLLKKKLERFLFKFS